MEEHIFEEIKRYVGFDEADEARLRALRTRVTPHARDISDQFYAHILNHSGARRSITGGDGQVLALKHTLAVWITELFEGPWDLTYYERRARIGRRHVEIDLPQQYMLTAMNTIRGPLTCLVLETASDLTEAVAEVRAVDRILDIDLAVMLHTYREDSLSRLQRNERLATVGQFAASIAHELRNPLGVIESSSFLLRRRMSDAPETITRHLDKIDGQVRVSNRIITSLLDVVRDRAAAPRDISATQLLQSALDALPGSASPPRVDVPGGFDAVVCVDIDQLRQVLVNLLANARDAAGPQGEVLVTLRAEGADVIFVVSDNGPGVAPEVRARLFEPLVTTKVRGIGLGLALCRRLCERNGAQVALARGPLPGAAFQVRIPRAQEAK